MKRLIIFIFVAGIMFSGCESPFTPDIEKAIEHEKPEARISFACSPNPILYYRGFTEKFVLVLTEWAGVSVQVDGASVAIWSVSISPNRYYLSMAPCWGYIRLGDKQIPARGTLEIECKLWLPLYIVPTKAEIVINMTDANGHTHQILETVTLAIRPCNDGG